MASRTHRKKSSRDASFRRSYMSGGHYQAEGFSNITSTLEIDLTLRPFSHALRPRIFDHGTGGEPLSVPARPDEVPPICRAMLPDSSVTLLTFDQEAWGLTTIVKVDRFGSQVAIAAQRAAHRATKCRSEGRISSSLMASRDARMTSKRSILLYWNRRSSAWRKSARSRKQPGSIAGECLRDSQDR